MHACFVPLCLCLTAAPQETVQLGPVQASVEILPEAPRFGDPLTLIVRVVAEPDITVLMPEFGEALDRFQILDFVPKQQLDAENRTVHTQRYTLQPSTSGPQNIPPILIEFVDRRDGQRAAPDGQDTYELLTPRLEFEVASLLDADTQASMRPRLGTLQEHANAVPGGRWLWFVALPVALAAAAGLVWYFVRHRERVHHRSAYEIARASLDRLMQQPIPQGDTVETFFVELSATVRIYLENRFRLRAPELTSEEFLERAAQSPDLSREHQSLLRGFLQQSDLVKFAGWQPDDSTIREALEAADRFVEETRLTSEELSERPSTASQEESQHA